MPTITSQKFCNLLQEIHPILARENWPNEDFDKDATLWYNLQPALRFASQMLASTSSILWFTHLVFGTPTCHPGRGLWYLERTSKSFNIAAVDEAKQYLSVAAASTLKLRFGPTSGYGETRASDVYLNESFRDYFSSGDRSDAQDIYTSFLLGVTIIHEVVHGVYHMRVINEPRCLQRDALINYHNHCEPFFTEADMGELLPGFDMGAELGWRLEMYLFGLGFHANLTSRHGARNMRHVSILVSPACACPEVTRHESLAKFFQKSKWAQGLRRDLDPGVLRLVPPIHFDKDADGNWNFMYVPEAALVDVSDGLFLRKL